MKEHIMSTICNTTWPLGGFAIPIICTEAKANLPFHATASHTAKMGTSTCGHEQVRNYDKQELFKCSIGIEDSILFHVWYNSISHMSKWLATLGTAV